MTLGNGTTTTLDYDNQSALSGLSHAFVGGSGNIAFSYTRNQAGEIVGHHGNNDRYLWTAANVNPTYAANGLNQYTAVGSRTLTYDARANLTGDGQWTYTYDSDNRLRTARSTSLEARLDYDPIDRLRQTTFNAEWALIYNGSMDMPIVVPLSTPVTRTTRLVYDGSDLIAEYDGAAPDTVQRRHVHGPGIDEPLVTYTGSGTANKTWLYSDHQGSVVAQAGASGANTAIDAYGPFGETDPAAGTRFGYTGQRYLAPLGLYDYKARFYSPTLGRFLQTDPIGYRDDNNLYAYVGNNPVNRRDPWGLSTLAVGREMPVMLADGGGAMKVLTTMTDTPMGSNLFNHAQHCGCLGNSGSQSVSGDPDLDRAAGLTNSSSRTVLSSIDAPLYGPYHRLEGGRPEVVLTIVVSNELWGGPSRNTYTSNLASVKAYTGSLPEGKAGVEFYTTVAPTLGSHPLQPRWYVGTLGVTPAPLLGYVRIPIKTTNYRLFDQ